VGDACFLDVFPACWRQNDSLWTWGL